MTATITAKRSKYKSPSERGGCDSYYRRGQCAHYYNESGVRINWREMTKEQIAEYDKGFEDNEKQLDFKEWM